MGIAVIRVLLLLEIWASFFQAYCILRFSDFEFFFFLIQVLRSRRKMCRLFPCILIFKGFFIKSVKKCVCVVELKIALLLLKNVFINVGKDISKLGRQIAAKRTAPVCCDKLFKISEDTSTSQRSLLNDTKENNM